MPIDLRFHLDRYKNNRETQNLLKNLVQLIKETLNVEIQYNSTYIRIDFPSGKKWAWIDTLEGKDYFRLRFHENDEGGNESFPELKEYDEGLVKLENRKGSGFSGLVLKGSFNIYNPKFIDFLKRKYNEYWFFYEKGIEKRNIKKDFFATLGDENSLKNYQKAYIILLLRGFFEHTDFNGKVAFDKLASFFKEFYTDRKRKGFKVEDNPDYRIENIETSTINDIKNVIKQNPLNTKTLENYLFLQDDQIVLNENLWLQLSRNDIAHIQYILDRQLEKYFNERVDGNSMAIPEVEREKIIQALKEFDVKLRDTEEWCNFTQKKNHKYAISHDGKLYPVKKIISLATGAHVSTFSGGEEANNYLKNKGFDIIDLNNLQLGTLKEKFEKIMDEYVNARRFEEFTGHPLGDLFRNEVPEKIYNYLSGFQLNGEDQYIVRGSIGQGNWAYVPWIAIMDKDITDTTRQGVYVVYLFSEDMERLYLTLNQGVSLPSREEIIRTRDKIRAILDLSFLKTDNELSLAESGLGKDYELSTIGYIEYKKGSIPEEDKLLKDLKRVMEVYKEYKEKLVEGRTTPIGSKEREIKPEDIIKRINEFVQNKGFTYPPGLIENFYLSLKTKPFVLLAGISGTGKTKLVELFARALGCTIENGRFELISVRPDWNDGSDLLGYKDIRGKFQPGPILKIIKRACEDPDNIYFVCLDEMNLARVEYYFSDFLSIMETRKKTSGGIVTAPLLKENDFEKDEDKENYAGIWLPDNLFIVGTVNMDETTHPFSKKVLDRANTIEFSEVDLTSIKLNNEEDIEIELDLFGGIHPDFLKPEYLTLNDCSEGDRELIVKVVEKLQEINDILQKAYLHVGYRVRDEICFYMLYNHKLDLLKFEDALDFQIMQKILPRIQGSSAVIKDILMELFKFAGGKDFTKEEGRIGDQAVKYADENELIYPRTGKKIALMLNRFEEDGFTAYWL